MYYFVPLSLPANTLEANKIEEVLQVSPGLIDDIEVEFPSGCVGLVHCTISLHAYQIVPWNLTSSLSGDNRIIKVYPAISLIEEPLEIIIRGWNLDDTYTHTLNVSINISKQAEPTVKTLLLGI